MKILVTGANGQLGTTLRDMSQSINDLEFTFVGKDQLNIADNRSLDSFFSNNTFDWVINTAAYTNVNGAQFNREVAFTVNGFAVRELVRHLPDSTRLIHISTDYVFNGKHYKPYTEKQKPNPINKYGESKLFGEEAILSADRRDIIIRTSWLYSYCGLNFFRKMITFGRNMDKLSIVCDQIGAPTYAEHLAQFIIRRICNEDFKNGKPEIYNYTNSGVASWYDFTTLIMDLAKLECEVLPITDWDYNGGSVAKRPHYSVLSLEKIRQEFGVVPPHWTAGIQDALEYPLEQLVLH